MLLVLGDLLESLKQGEIPRWVGNHQGGYPVEFYPLGEAWLEVGVWALLLGSVPILYSWEFTSDRRRSPRIWSAVINAFLHPTNVLTPFLINLPLLWVAGHEVEDRLGRRRVLTGGAVFAAGLALAIWAILTIRQAGSEVETTKPTTAMPKFPPCWSARSTCTATSPSAAP